MVKRKWLSVIYLAGTLSLTSCSSTKSVPIGKRLCVLCDSQVYTYIQQDKDLCYVNSFYITDTIKGRISYQIDKKIVVYVRGEKNYTIYHTNFDGYFIK